MKKRHFSSLLFSLVFISAGVGVGEARSAGTSVPPAGTLTFGNFADFAMDGYCLGISCLLALAHEPEQNVQAVFGRVPSTWLQNVSASDVHAVKWLRILSVLQNDRNFYQGVVPASLWPSPDLLRHTAINLGPLFLIYPHKSDPEFAARDIQARFAELHSQLKNNGMIRKPIAWRS